MLYIPLQSTRTLFFSQEWCGVNGGWALAEHGAHCSPERRRCLDWWWPGPNVTTWFFTRKEGVIYGEFSAYGFHTGKCKSLGDLEWLETLGSSPCTLRSALQQTVCLCSYLNRHMAVHSKPRTSWNFIVNPMGFYIFPLLPFISLHLSCSSPGFRIINPVFPGHGWITHDESWLIKQPRIFLAGMGPLRCALGGTWWRNVLPEGDVGDVGGDGYEWEPQRCNLWSLPWNIMV